MNISQMKRKTGNDLWVDYQNKYGKDVKHDYLHFTKTLTKVIHHREIVRPKIEFWSTNIKKI